VSLAAGLGCDYVKFQKRDPDLCVPEHQKDVPKACRWGPIPYIEYRRRMEFGEDDYAEIDGHCNAVGIGWFASAWDHNSAHFLADIGVPFLKVPSAQATNPKLLTALRGLGLPVVLSTGMSTDEQVRHAVSELGTCLAYLLHCVSSYPTPDDEVNMGRMLLLRNRYRGVAEVGYSNHSPKTTFPIFAAALGARMVEFHLTICRDGRGSDHAASFDPVRAARVVNGIRDAALAFEADPSEAPQPSEVEAAKRLRRVLP